MHAHNKTVIIICGPTASGKTSVAIRLAQHFQTEIISADSRQCYREMNIGVARPSEEQLHTIKHHFIASHSVHEKITAVDFEKYALQKTAELFETRDFVVMVGGTGLYLKAFTEGLDEIPDIDEDTRDSIIKDYKEKGIGWLQSELLAKDPAFAERGEMQNPQRMMRALEVVECTGQSILDFRKGIRMRRPFSILKFGLQVSMEELKKNIDNRVDKMIESGLLQEAQSLLPYRDLTALQTVGYKELFEYFLSAEENAREENTKHLQAAIEKIKLNTRKYAKRQMTWFKKDKEIMWLDPGDVNAVISYAEGNSF